MLEHAGTMLGQGMGLLGYLYDLSGDGPRFMPPRTLGVPDGPWAQIITGLERHATPQVLARMRYGAAFATLTDQLHAGEIDQAAYEMGRRVYGLGGVGDVLGFNSFDPGTQQGCFVCAMLPEAIRTRPSEGARWTRLATHVRAGIRLRTRLGAIEAVLDPDGAVQHAEGPARHSTARAHLRDSVRAVDRARTGQIEPDDAVDLWKGLVSGRWSLLDRFESDGRRFVVARRNPPDVADPRALTERERDIAAYLAQGHGDKQIAYELGLARPTITNHIRAIATKLGAPSRTALVQLVRALQGTATLENDARPEPNDHGPSSRGQP